MRRVLVAAVVLGACSVAPSNTPPLPTASPPLSFAPSPSPSPTPTGAFVSDRAMQDVRHLAVTIGKRVAGTSGENAAREYIFREMQAAGLQVTRQEFQRADGGTSVNVIGRFKGAGYGEGFLVVGGHYDTKGESPGANDNATGIAVLLELARSLAAERRPLELVAFAAEEVSPSSGKNHEGSLAYIERMGQAPKPSAMVSVDMVGNGPNLNLISLRRHDPSLREELSAIARTHSIPTVSGARGNISDHGPFAMAGIPAALVWTGPHPSVHTASDTIEVVQPDALERAGRLALLWARTR